MTQVDSHKPWGYKKGGDGWGTERSANLTKEETCNLKGFCKKRGKKVLVRE